MPLKKGVGELKVKILCIFSLVSLYILKILND
jgi:hypothetical protein